MAPFTLQHKLDGSTITLDSFDLRMKRMRKRVGEWCRAVDPHWRDYLSVMITLTYDNNHKWEPNQMREFMLRLRKWAGSRLMAYCWVAELGSLNGRLHYHCVVVLKRGDPVPFPDKMGWWPYGLTKTHKVEKTVFYIVKYLSKVNQSWAGRLHVQGVKCGADGFPVRLRLYACVIYSRMPLDDSERNTFRSTAWKSSVRKEVLNHLAIDESWAGLRVYPVKGGGWMVDSDRGSSFLESMYVYLREKVADLSEAALAGLTEYLAYIPALGRRVVITLPDGVDIGFGADGLPAFVPKRDGVLCFPAVGLPFLLPAPK